MPSFRARMKLIGELLHLSFQIPYEEDVEDTAAVIAVPFNCYVAWDDEPDYTNGKIAEIAAKYIAPSRPFVGQWEHTELLRERDFFCLQYPGSNGEGKWVKTHELLKWTAARVKEFGNGRRVVMVGHPHHLPRAAALARYYGLEPVLVPESKDVPYDPRIRPGYQDWCVNERAWRWFEFCKARPALIAAALIGLI